MKGLYALLLGIGITIQLGGTAIAQGDAPKTSTRLLLSTTSFTDGGVLPKKYTQASPSPVTPSLSWTNVPAGTMSFTLILHDVDGAPRKGSADVLHWMVFNIPGTTTSLPEGVPPTAMLPDGSVQPNNSSGRPGFMAPGWFENNYHHYTFELYALDTKLNLGPIAARDEVIDAMNGHVIGKAAIEARFHL